MAVLALTDIAALAAGIVAGLVVVAVLIARAYGHGLDKGFKNGRIYENQMLCKHMKGHPAENGEWHELLGQFRDDVDVVIINSTKTRELGMPTYLYTALHEGFHSFFHKDKDHTGEAIVKQENEANDFAITVLPGVMQALVEKGYLKPEDAKPPELFKIDGIPQVLYGDALTQLQELIAIVKQRDPGAHIEIRSHKPPINSKGVNEAQ